jgi:hypothetical protein
MSTETAKPAIGEIVTIRTDKIILPFGELAEVEYKGKVLGYETVSTIFGSYDRTIYEVCADMPLYGYKAGDTFNG